MSKDTILNIPINLEYGSLKQALDWCQENCVGNWGYETGYGWPPDDYNFWFEDDRDVVRFQLRWL